MKQISIVILLIFALSSSLKAQETQEQEPKVGLVLSGGGAKGFAHIGVLKVIDSLGIRVDYVAGTSMGAIIGSLYASGYSGKQLDSIFKGVDFDNLIADNIPRSAQSTYEREISERYAVTLPFDHLKVKLPSALSRGQNTFNLLTKLMLHVSYQDDFSKLPIPFFCIATNVETGQQVVLDKGNLSQAVRASGSFPSLFRPVEIDGKLSPSVFSAKVCWAVSLEILASSLLCNIVVVSLANKIFNSLISLFLVFSISSIEISVKIFKNFKTSRSSIFLQNCQ